MKILQYRFVAVLSIILFFQTVSAQVILKQLGQHPFYQPSLTSLIELNTMINNNKSDVKNGFELVGLSELFDDFVLQLPNAKIEIVEICDNSHFEWMFARKNGEGPVRIVKDVTWIGKTPFSAFQFYIDKNGKRYNFTVPLICGNIALSEITRTPDVFVLPTEETLDKSSAVTTYQSDKTKKDVVLPIVAAAGASALKFLSDIGYLHQFDPGHYFLGRVGAEYNFSDNFSLLGLVGVAPHISGTDGKNAFLADVLGEYKFGKSFINLGVGGWLTKGDDGIPTENTQLDLIGALGTRLFGEPDSFNISLFLETRQGLGELGSVHDIRSFGRYGGGLRFRF